MASPPLVKLTVGSPESGLSTVKLRVITLPVTALSRLVELFDAIVKAVACGAVLSIVKASDGPSSVGMVFPETSVIGLEPAFFIVIVISPSLLIVVRFKVKF